MAKHNPIFSSKGDHQQIGYIEGNEAFDLLGEKRCNYSAATGNLCDPGSGKILGHVSLQGKFVGASWIAVELFSRSKKKSDESARDLSRENVPRERFGQHADGDGQADLDANATAPSPSSEGSDPAPQGFAWVGTRAPVHKAYPQPLSRADGDMDQSAGRAPREWRLSLARERLGQHADGNGQADLDANATGPNRSSEGTDAEALGGYAAVGTSAPELRGAAAYSEPFSRSGGDTDHSAGKSPTERYVYDALLVLARDALFKHSADGNRQADLDANATAPSPSSEGSDPVAPEGFASVGTSAPVPEGGAAYPEPLSRSDGDTDQSAGDALREWRLNIARERFGQHADGKGQANLDTNATAPSPSSEGSDPVAPEGFASVGTSAPVPEGGAAYPEPLSRPDGDTDQSAGNSPTDRNALLILARDALFKHHADGNGQADLDANATAPSLPSEGSDPVAPEGFASVGASAPVPEGGAAYPEPLSRPDGDTDQSAGNSPTERDLHLDANPTAPSPTSEGSDPVAPEGFASVGTSAPVPEEGGAAYPEPLSRPDGDTDRSAGNSPTERDLDDALLVLARDELFKHHADGNGRADLDANATAPSPSSEGNDAEAPGGYAAVGISPPELGGAAAYSEPLSSSNGDWKVHEKVKSSRDGDYGLQATSCELTETVNSLVPDKEMQHEPILRDQEPIGDGSGPAGSRKKLLTAAYYRQRADRLRFALITTRKPDAAVRLRTFIETYRTLADRADAEIESANLSLAD
jgi:hypothetical protein